MRVLLSAYACAPDGVSEAGNGWGWASHLAARGIEIHVLTAERHRQSVEAEQRVRPRENLSFSFVEPRIPGLPGEGGWHYLAWQFAAVKLARKQHARAPFDLVHHITYSSIHVPSQLWRLGLPIIFGPVGGGQTSPVSMLSYFGETKRKEIFRTLFTKSLRFSLFHRMWLSRMTCVFVTNNETGALARQLGRHDAVLCFDPGLPGDFYAERPRSFDSSARPLRLLWTGRMFPRKALALTLDALKRSTAPVVLTVLGDGIPAEVLREMITERGLDGKVDWRGRVPWSEVRNAYQEHDGFLFTSLRDSCAAQLLEAMALGLPIITLDLHGGGSMVPDGAGFKVPVTDPESTASAIAQAIDNFARLTPTERSRLSEAGWQQARLLSWPTRAERAHRLYESILRRNALPLASFHPEPV